MKTLKVGDVVKDKTGNDVRIVCVDARGDYPIIGLVKLSKTDKIISYTKKGHYVLYLEGANDLVLTEKKKGWVNIYREFAECKPSNVSGRRCSSRIQATKALAEKNAEYYPDEFIATVPIEWEE